MSDGDAANGDAATTTDGGTTDGTTTTDTTAAGSATTAGGNSGRTFTQEELDDIVQSRLAKERKKYGDYEDLQSKAGKLAEIEDSQRSEAEKAAERTAELERSNAANATAVQEARLENAVLKSANKVGIVDADAAVKLLDHSEIEFDGDGKPKNVEKLLTKLLEDRPYLAGQTTRTTSFDGGARPASSAGRSMDDLIRGSAG